MIVERDKGRYATNITTEAVIQISRCSVVMTKSDVEAETVEDLIAQEQTKINLFIIDAFYFCQSDLSDQDHDLPILKKTEQ